nr:zinc finger, CCHC-type [Tanacetum cinerariifolium]
MGIHDFLCLLEWTSVEVQVEPHLDVMSTLQRLSFYYTHLATADVVIPDPTLEDLAICTPSFKILAKAEASQKQKASTFCDFDDECDGDDDACVEIMLVTPLRSTVVILTSGNQDRSSTTPPAEGFNTQDSQGKGIMADDADASSVGAIRPRPSYGPAPSFNDVFGDAIYADLFPFSAAGTVEGPSLCLIHTAIELQIFTQQGSKNMSSIAKFDVEKFDRSNDFELWRVKMRCLLIQHGWEAALDPFPGTMTNVDRTATLKTDVYKKAHSALLLCLDNKVLREVNKEDSAARDRLKLKTLYMTKSLANKLYLKKKLFTFDSRLKDELGTFASERAVVYCTCGMIEMVGGGRVVVDNRGGSAAVVTETSTHGFKSKIESILVSGLGLSMFETKRDDTDELCC